MAAAGSHERADLSLPALTAPPTLQLREQGAAVARALAHFATALQFEEAGKLREALTHYQAVLEADPSNAAVAMHAAELTYNFQGRGEAIAILEKVLERRPEDPAAYLNLARFCATYAPEDPFEKDRAAQAVERALKRFPENAEVYAFATVVHLAAGARDQAEAVMEQASQQQVEQPDFWLTLGRAAQQVWPLGQAESREAHLQEVNPFFEKALRLASGKRADEVRLEVAQYYLLTNQLEEARTLCQQIASRSGNLLARKLLYRLHEAFNDRDKALAVLEGIVKDAPSDVEQRRLLAAAYQARQEFAKAVPHLEAAIQIGGGEVEDYLALGELLLRSQLYEKLVQLSQRSLKLFPEQAMFHVHAGLAHRALEHLQPAIASFAAAAELAEGGQSELANHRFYFLYGVTLERGGRHEEAGRVLEKAITLTPKDETEQAASTMNYLGYMWLELDRYLEKAGELIRKANELHPNSAAYIDSLGWWYYKRGEYDKALKELQRAISLIPELQPEDAEIVEHLGHVYLKLNETENAREQFQKALSLGPTDAKVRKRIEAGLKAVGGATAPRVETPAPQPTRSGETKPIGDAKPSSALTPASGAKPGDRVKPTGELEKTGGSKATQKGPETEKPAP